jgi:ABC-2 type transport system permease protein
VLRDPLTLFFMLFPPLIEMIAFGYALDNDVKHMYHGRPRPGPHGGEPADHRPLRQHRDLPHRGAEVGSVEELAAEIRRGHAHVGLQIPPNFTRDLRAGATRAVQMLIDGSSSTIAGSALDTPPSAWPSANPSR